MGKFRKTTRASNQPFRFLDLPAELRNQIYELILDPAYVRKLLPDGFTTTYDYDLALFHVNRQIYVEARNVFWLRNIFARIETPWSEAEHHVSVEGMVPVIASGHLADTFSHIHARAIIDAPYHGPFDRDTRKFIVFVDDLDKFCQMWVYSDLGYGGDLNPHLRLRLCLQNPSVPDSGEHVQLTKSLQKRIMLPFGVVRNLKHVEVISEARGEDIVESVEKEMREIMSVPYESAESCLEEAEKLKEKAVQWLYRSMLVDPKRALECCIESFRKMHIVCIGHRRSIWADAWFDRTLVGGPFDGRHGQVVRLILRIELVAAVVKSYLDLKEYPEAHFWGMRTINLMREQVDESDVSSTAGYGRRLLFHRHCG